MATKKISQIIYYICLFFLVLIILFFIGSVLPITGNYKVLTVISGSMEPAIKTGSVVVVKPVEDYKIGDIITFGPYSKTKAPITHRIYDIKIEGGNPVYITKGDANNAPDTREIQKRDILGKALFSVPYFGYVVDFTKKPLGFVLIIMIPTTLIIFDEAKKIYREVKKRKAVNS